LESIAEGCVVVDSTLTVHYCNPAFAAIFGRPVADLFGVCLAEDFPGLVESGFTQLCELTFLHGSSHRGGAWLGGRWYEIRTNAVSGGVFVLLGDATAQQRPVQPKHDDLHSPQERLPNADKVERLDRLVGGVVHDFNNLLVGILNGAELLARDLPSGEARETAEMISKAAQRARDVARQILITVGKVRSTYQRFDVNLLLRENLYLLKLTFPDPVQVQADLFDGMLWVYADPGQIQQVVMNLLVNAGEALSPSGGTVRVATRLVQADDPPVTAASEAAQRYVCIEIADDGPGMAPDVQSRIFEPFFTTKPAGHGLGLAAVKNILRAHNGLINVTSSVGRGTTFQIFLPIVAAERLPETPPVVTATSSDPREVLIVDDEPYVLDVVSRMLRNAGYATQTAGSGPKALALLSEQPRIGVVILDLKMPEMDGLETLRRLTDVRPDLRVIITSGCSGTEEAVVKDPRVIGFIAKPYVLATLVKMVQEGLDSVHAP
jgi:signal transduction histidine kinase